jgi:hypothetical protein
MRLARDNGVLVLPMIPVRYRTESPSAVGTSFWSKARSAERFTSIWEDSPERKILTRSILVQLQRRRDCEVRLQVRHRRENEPRDLLGRSRRRACLSLGIDSCRNVRVRGGET